ncbi:MAG: histone deacetylase family protein [Anaerolineae bacterium]
MLTSGAPVEPLSVVETAVRGETLHQAIMKANLGLVTPPGDFSIEPLGDIHEYGMLALLKIGFNRTASEEKQPFARPHTFNNHGFQTHKPWTVMGAMGQYCFDNTAPLLAHTWDAAYWAAQTAVSAAAFVAAGENQLAYALCRPPGHHAGPDFYGGFCYLNNTAIAANWLVKQGQRIAILDLDYHHGNGTQMVFYGRSDVLTLSLHADPFFEYPYFWGYADEYGSGPGENYNFNYPLPRGAQEPAYVQALTHALDRIRRFVPDTLLVSLGLDTFENDPLGTFRLTTNSFYRIGQQLAAMKLPVVTIQEGGYDIPSLGDNVIAFFQGLSGLSRQQQED